MRTKQIERNTKETRISVTLNLDGSGETRVSTGIGFFDHMLDALGRHSGFDLSVSADGDLNVDCHHTVEDTGIAIGKALAAILSDKAGLERYGSFYVPMDEALAFAAVDISGRPFLVFDCSFTADRVGEFDTAMTEEFFRALAFNAGLTLHLKLLYGTDDHHKIEALFKAAGHALRVAATKTGDALLSTKGILE